MSLLTQENTAISSAPAFGALSGFAENGKMPLSSYFCERPFQNISVMHQSEVSDWCIGIQGTLGNTDFRRKFETI